MEIPSLGGSLEVWLSSFSRFIRNLDLDNFFLWTSTTTFVKGEAQHIFLLRRTLSSPELKMLLFESCVLLLLGAIKHVRCILAKVQPGRRQRSLFPQWQHLYSKQDTGASYERLFNMPSKAFFQKLVAASLQGKGLRGDRLSVPFLNLTANGTVPSDVDLAVIHEHTATVLSLSAKA